MSAVEEVRNLIDEDEETYKEQQEQLRHLQKEAFQLANYYFVFQGVIFTAFYSTPSSLKCEYHWIPFTLSFIAGFLNLCALFTIACKYKTILDDIDRAATTPATDGPGRSSSEAIAVRCERFQRLFCVVFCMGLFIGFLVITLIGSWEITCGKSQPATAAGPPPPA